MSDRMDDVLSSIDEALAGADYDPYVSGDAMRWAPPEEPRELPKRPVDRYTMGRASYHNPPSMAFEVPMRNGAQTADAWAEAFASLAAACAGPTPEELAANVRALGEAFRSTEPEPPPTGEEFRRRALEHIRNRNTGPQRRDNRRWRNT